MKPYVPEILTIELETNQKLGSGVKAQGEMTESGLFITTKTEERSEDKNKSTAEGVIMSVGPDVQGLEIGYRVVFNRYSARGFEFEGGEYITLNANEVFAVVINQ